MKRLPTTFAAALLLAHGAAFAKAADAPAKPASVHTTISGPACRIFDRTPSCCPHPPPQCCAPGSEVDLRADANAMWGRTDAAEILAAMTPVKLSSIEEPLRDRDLEGCALLRRRGVRVMLDESRCSLADAERAIAADAADLFNLRLSKCGGLFGALRLVQRAERAGIAWQLGCMVGESGILSCLGRSFVARIRGARYFESTVPTKSLEADITSAQLDHVPGTRDTPVPMGPGFGAKIVPAALERYTVAQLTVAGA